MNSTFTIIFVTYNLSNNNMIGNLPSKIFFFLLPNMKVQYIILLTSILIYLQVCYQCFKYVVYVKTYYLMISYAHRQYSPLIKLITNLWYKL